jgi:hypothetical protein
VVAEHRLRRGAPGRAERDRSPACLPRSPVAVPIAGAHVEQEIRRIADGPAAAVVSALVRGQQPPIRQEEQPKALRRPQATSSSPELSGLQRSTAAVHGTARGCGARCRRWSYQTGRTRWVRARLPAREDPAVSKVAADTTISRRARPRAGAVRAPAEVERVQPHHAQVGCTRPG